MLNSNIYVVLIVSEKGTYFRSFFCLCLVTEFITQSIQLAFPQFGGQRSHIDIHALVGPAWMTSKSGETFPSHQIAIQNLLYAQNTFMYKWSCIKLALRLYIVVQPAFVT